jgi:hypothetical protein
MLENWPPLNGLRLATHNDLCRIAFVAAAGFYHTAYFQYHRAHFNNHPEDTVASYYANYLKSLDDPCTIMLVAEDIVQDDEIKHVYPSLQSIYPK